MTKRVKAIMGKIDILSKHELAELARGLGEIYEAKKEDQLIPNAVTARRRWDEIVRKRTEEKIEEGARKTIDFARPMFKSILNETDE